MVVRWILAVTAVCALAFLTLPVWPELSVESASSTGSEQVAKAGTPSAVCESDPEVAPLDHVLMDMDGNAIDLSSFRGKVVLLNFWATWCGPCRVEIPEFVELQEEYGDDGLVILGLSVDDTPEQMRPFAEQYKVNYPFLVGLDENDFQEAWGPVFGLPASFLISRDGAWCRTHTGRVSKKVIEEEIQTLLAASP